MTNPGQYSTRISDERVRDLTRLPAPYYSKLLLYDYDTGDAEIGGVHQEAIEDHFIKYLRGVPSTIWIGGLASRLGEEGRNRRLSILRAQNVSRRVAFLSGSNIGSRSIVTTQFGESMSVGGDEDSSYHRAVLLVAVRRPPLQQSPPTPPVPRTLTFDRFRLRMLGGFDGGPLVIAGAYQFEIDYDSRQPLSPPSSIVRYRFIGAGLGYGAPGSVTAQGPWNYFRTTRNCSTYSFAGRGQLGSLADPGAKGGGGTYFNLITSRYGAIEFSPLEVGPSSAFGVSSLEGPFRRM